DAVEEKYFTAARELGEKLARRGWRLVYGGGSVGLMGVLSRAVLAGGGHVTGVIPKAPLDLGVGEGGVSELIVTDGLRDRKAITHTPEVRLDRNTLRRHDGTQQGAKNGPDQC